MSFLDDVGGILTVPSQHYVCESSVSATGPPDVTDDDTGMRVLCILCACVCVCSCVAHTICMLLKMVDS